MGVFGVELWTNELSQEKKLNFKCILLGLIHLHPSVSGYDLKTIINKSTGYFFSASLSMIYPALKELTQEGFITYEVEPLVGKQDRKVYTITPEGHQKFLAWLHEPLELKQSLNAFEDFLLKLTFFGMMEDGAILEFLTTAQNHFRNEMKRLYDNNLANEREYIKMGSPLDQRYIALWSFENEFILDDLDRKILWIEKLIEIVRAGDLQAKE